jgi:poly(A) polymerase
VSDIYLVGGAVRDALLSRDNKDIDFVCTGNAKSDAMYFCNKIQGDFFVLDEERNTCRVIKYDNQHGRLVFDFAQQRGNSIQEDLSARDFTLNAMALPIFNATGLIDPLNGARDLRTKNLKPCRDTSFIDDPLRVIRAVRYATAYQLKISTETLSLLKASVPAVRSVSKERKRDELFKILDISTPWIAFRLMQKLGILDSVGIPPLVDFEKSMARLKILSQFLAYILGQDGATMGDSMILASFVSAFKPFRQKMSPIYSIANSSDRTLHGLNELTTVLWEQDQIFVEKVTSELVLSNDEAYHCQLIFENRDAFTRFLKSDAAPDDREIYLYFKRLGAAGIDLILMQLTNLASVPAAEFNDRNWLEALSIGQKLLESWFNRPDVINPKLKLNGRDLMFEFDLPQGPLIGQLLETLREEQAAGVIKTREQAIEWVEHRLTLRSIG